MKYYVYKITQLKTGLFYIGKHKTKNNRDYYRGSGNWIKNCSKKYGKTFWNNFTKDILCYAKDENELHILEYKIINEHISNVKCKNILSDSSCAIGYGKKHVNYNNKTYSIINREGEVKTLTQHQMKYDMGFNSGHIYQLINGKCNTIRGWVLYDGKSSYEENLENIKNKKLKYGKRRFSYEGENAPTYDETLYKVKRYDNEIFTSTQYNLKKEHGIKNVSALVKGKIPSLNGYYLIDEKGVPLDMYIKNNIEKRPYTYEEFKTFMINKEKKKCKFIHDNGDVEILYPSDMSKKYSLTSGNFYGMINGKIKKHKGWRIDNAYFDRL